ncbi:MAG TPA: retroviral-like aspartic protease family protein [Fimbriimonadaceae bacterium]|nr:retroviral-like aspartic protease family protein [Fimbriimonadaceae bacterium]
MGEVRVRVHLANIFDERRARHGEIAKSDVRHYEADALVDTGAVRCIVPQFVVEQLGLEVADRRGVEDADGRVEVVPVTEPISMTILNRNEREDALVLGDEVLIGQTALEKMDLLVDCARKQVVPNPAHPDQPVNKVK